MACIKDSYAISPSVACIGLGFFFPKQQHDCFIFLKPPEVIHKFNHLPWSSIQAWTLTAIGPAISEATGLSSFQQPFPKFKVEDGWILSGKAWSQWWPLEEKISHWFLESRLNLLPLFTPLEPCCLLFLEHCNYPGGHGRNTQVAGFSILRTLFTSSSVTKSNSTRQPDKTDLTHLHKTSMSHLKDV